MAAVHHNGRHDAPNEFSTCSSPTPKGAVAFLILGEKWPRIVGVRNWRRLRY
jgi:hypothetical protein